MSYKTKFSPNSKYSKLLIIRFTAYSRSPNCSYIQTRTHAHKFCWDLSIIRFIIHISYNNSEMREYRSARAEAIFGETLCQTTLPRLTPLSLPAIKITGTLHISSVCSFPLVIILCCNFYALFFYICNYCNCNSNIYNHSVSMHFFKLTSVLFFGLFWLHGC